MLSHLKSEFSCLQCIDVEENPIPLDDASIFIPKRYVAVQKPAVDSINVPESPLLFQRLFGGQCGAPVSHLSIDVVGVNRTCPAPPHRLFSGLAGVVQPTLAQK